MREANATGLSARLNAPLSEGFTLDVALTLPACGLTALLGPSGSGKTSVLRALAGLMPSVQGRVQLGGEIWQGENHWVATHRRRLGYVFQEASLLPGKTVRQQLHYAQKRALGEQRIDLAEVASLTEIGALMNRPTRVLSGGQRQRVAIASALLCSPRLLLMDEPLASLDQESRRALLPLIERIRDHWGLPIVYVSHSLEEVTRLADYLVVMEAGRVIEQGDASELLARRDWSRPLDEPAGSVLNGRVAERDEHWALMRIAVDGGDLWLADTGARVDTNLRVRVRARDVSLTLDKPQHTSILNQLPVTIEAIAPDTDPALALVTCQLGQARLTVQLTRRSAEALALEPGQQVWAQLKTAAVID